MINIVIAIYFMGVAITMLGIALGAVVISPNNRDFMDAIVVIFLWPVLFLIRFIQSAIKIILSSLRG